MKNRIVLVESRAGNAILGAFGLLFVFAAPALLVYYVLSVRGAMRWSDVALQLMLMVIALFGGWLIAGTWGALRSRRERRPTPRAAGTESIDQRFGQAS
ncbi:MAG: hypothetical protein WBX15_14425 [Thermoanaerobaculia bacterium]